MPNSSVDVRLPAEPVSDYSVSRENGSRINNNEMAWLPRMVRETAEKQRKINILKIRTCILSRQEDFGVFFSVVLYLK